MDHLLQSLNWEREYIQLHRDTTVQSLTLVSKVEHGVVSFEDSPLVKAVVHGRVLVVDEADKAPLEVNFCIGNFGCTCLCYFEVEPVSYDATASAGPTA